MTVLRGYLIAAANIKWSSVALAHLQFIGNLFQIVAASERNAASQGLRRTPGTDRKPVPADVWSDGSEVTRRSEVYFWTEIISGLQEYFEIYVL